LVWVKHDGMLRMEGGLLVGHEGGRRDRRRTRCSSINRRPISSSRRWRTTRSFRTTRSPGPLKNQVGLILEEYTSSANARDIRLIVPTQLPLEAYCEVYRDQGPRHLRVRGGSGQGRLRPRAQACKILWNSLDTEEFGLEGVRIDHPIMGVTEDDLLPERYLTMGIGDHLLSEGLRRRYVHVRILRPDERADGGRRQLDPRRGFCLGFEHGRRLQGNDSYGPDDHIPPLGEPDPSDTVIPDTP
jgi:hypothetical protein